MYVDVEATPVMSDTHKRHTHRRGRLSGGRSLYLSCAGNLLVSLRPFALCDAHTPPETEIDLQSTNTVVDATITKSAISSLHFPPTAWRAPIAGRRWPIPVTIGSKPRLFKSPLRSLPARMVKVAWQWKKSIIELEFR